MRGQGPAHLKSPDAALSLIALADGHEARRLARTPKLEISSRPELPAALAGSRPATRV